jgi:5-methylthioadenosine/S-adenosylhomocysteine deaminase
MTWIIWAGLAITDASGPVETDYAVAVAQGRIVAAGPLTDLRHRYPAAELFGGEELLLLPAFVNAHDHGRGLGTLSLGIPDDLLEIWLPGLYNQPATDPYQIARLEGLLLLQSGVGTTAHSHNPRNWANLETEAEATLAGYREAGIRVAFHPPMVDQNPLVYADRQRFLAGLPTTLQEAAQQFLRTPPYTHQEYLGLCDRLFDQYHDATNHTVHIQISPAGGQWCSDELILAAVDWAQRRGTRIQMHMLETRYQHHYAFKRWGKSFVQHLAEIGALGPWLTLAHTVWLEPDDIPLLAAAGVGIAHNPSSNLRLRSGVAPIPALLAPGVRTGVGLDGQALDDDQDYLRELRLAWTLANQPGAAAPTIGAAQILTMGTADGAAITLGEQAGLGRLVVGAPADLILVDWAAVIGVWLSPQTPVAAALLRRASKAHIRHVMVNGEWVIRDGRSTRIDQAEVVATLRMELASYDPAALAANAAAAHALAPYLRRFYAAWDA